MKIQKKFQYLLTAGLLGSTMLLGGCAAAAMTAVGTAEGSEGTAIVVAPVTQNITSVKAVKVDATGVNQSESDNVELQNGLQAQITEALQSKNLWSPNDANGDTLEVTIRSVDQKVSGRAMYALINVKNTQGQVVYSFAYSEKSKGLRTISHVKSVFSENIVEQIVQANASLNK